MAETLPSEPPAPVIVKEELLVTPLVPPLPVVPVTLAAAVLFALVALVADVVLVAVAALIVPRVVLLAPTVVGVPVVLDTGPPFVRLAVIAAVVAIPVDSGELGFVSSAQALPPATARLMVAVYRHGRRRWRWLTRRWFHMIV
ncbi:MAG TPA: hypothetical protein VFU02_12925 [Polyangiaceae bacterium]|nr:hypothetical protein [Polyangiaceae bacterium]